MKTAELREMSDEQLVLTLKETEHNLFRLRMQAQTERLDAPTFTSCRLFSAVSSS